MYVLREPYGYAAAAMGNTARQREPCGNRYAGSCMLTRLNVFIDNDSVFSRYTIDHCNRHAAAMTDTVAPLIVGHAIVFGRPAHIQFMQGFAAQIDPDKCFAIPGTIGNAKRLFNSFDVITNAAILVYSTGPIEDIICGIVRYHILSAVAANLAAFVKLIFHNEYRTAAFENLVRRGGVFPNLILRVCRKAQH